jgi:hypothetical protein
VGKPAGQARLQDDLALAGPIEEPVVEGAVDGVVGLGDLGELGQAEAALGRHLAEGGTAVEVVDPEVGATCRATVLVPEPGKPDKVISTVSGERGEERFALLAAQPAEPTRVGDADLLHGAAGLDLADTGKRFEHREDLGLADQLVGLGLGEHLGQRDGAELEPFLELGSRLAGGGRLLEGSGSLLGGE